MAKLAVFVRLSRLSFFLSHVTTSRRGARSDSRSRRMTAPSCFILHRQCLSASSSIDAHRSSFHYHFVSPQRFEPRRSSLSHSSRLSPDTPVLVIFLDLPSSSFLFSLPPPPPPFLFPVLSPRFILFVAACVGQVAFTQLLYRFCSSSSSLSLSTIFPPICLVLFGSCQASSSSTSAIDRYLRPSFVTPVSPHSLVRFLNAGKPQHGSS